MRHLTGLNDLGRDKVDTIGWYREADTVGRGIEFRSIAVRVGIPTRLPCISTKAPPLLPGLMAASV